MSTSGTLTADEQRLAELGYKQELNRGWSGFSNFAISFSIISVLAGCFTTYGQAWNNGGPIAISIGWPVISLLILTVAFSMSELASAMPTAGGIYYWASKLGGPAWGWFTGWFNLIGLVAVSASVIYVSAYFLVTLLGLYNVNFIFNFASTNVHYSAHIVFAMFALIIIVHGLINVFSSHLVSIFTSISVWWHVIGVAVIIVILLAVPSHLQSFSFVFTKRLNNSGFGMGMFWFYVLPLGFLLTMYTITGYDASAHVSEETNDAAMSAPKGVWKSVFYSAVIGWMVLLALTFAAIHPNVVSHSAYPRERAHQPCRQGGAPDLDGRSAVLRDGVRDERVADDLRVLAGRCDTGTQPLAAARLQPHADLVGAVRGRGRARDYDPGLLPELRRHTGGVPGGHFDLGDRPLHRLHHPGVLALACG